MLTQLITTRLIVSANLPMNNLPPPVLITKPTTKLATLKLKPLYQWTLAPRRSPGFKASRVSSLSNGSDIVPWVSQYSPSYGTSQPLPSGGISVRQAFGGQALRRGLRLLLFLLRWQSGHATAELHSGH